MFLEKHRGSHSLEYKMHSSVSDMKTITSIYFTPVTYRPPHTVKGIKICPPNFQSFSDQDLVRLKDDKRWLSDTHVTFMILSVSFFLLVSAI